MLSPFDDYPVHQTALPVAHPATGDPNQYDRYFFCGYDRDGELYFGAAMGHYPNRKVIDASLSVVHDGVQRSVFASGRIPLDRGRTRVGPIEVEVVEPLRTLRVTVDAAHLGITADVTFEARTAASEEPRVTMRDGTVLVMDSTRLTQWGSWSGAIDVEGTRLDLRPDRTLGTRDRSWGVRSVGEPVPGAPSGRPPQIFWLWAPLNFENECTHLARFESGDGTPWYHSAHVVPVLADGEATYGTEETIEELEGVDYTIDWEPGTRRAQAASLTLHHRSGTSELITFERLATFQMKGIGYFHPEWGHGRWHGEADEGAESWKLDEIDPLDPSSNHIQQLFRVTKGDEAGVGILEQIAIGPHEPTGLTGILDPAG